MDNNHFIKEKRVVYVMICSPSDVASERNQAFQLVYEWNQENLKKDMVLLPIGYENVAKNVAHNDTQELIKEQIVSMSNMAVIILWSTLGRKNKDGIEYTIEEANNHITKNLPALFLFSNAPIDQNSDFNAFNEVKEFRKHPENKLKDERTGEKRTCMYASYKNKENFPEIFRKELNRVVNEFFNPQTYSDNFDSHIQAEISSRKKEVIKSDFSDLEKAFIFPESFKSSWSHKKLWGKLVDDIKKNAYQRTIPEFIEFGRYPQQHVEIDKDNVLLKLVKSDDRGNVYKDENTEVMYYKPNEINLAPYASRYSYSDGTKITRTGEHYFLIKPIIWRVLRHGVESSLLLSDQILDWHHFLEPNLIEPQAHMILSTVEGCPDGTRANNWEWSTLRTWLDDVFIPTAFTDEEQAMIIYKEVSNSKNTGCIEENSEAIKMQCSNTKNKAFILSYADTVNPEYGFNPDPMAKDPLRIAAVTDFAIARGVKPSLNSLQKKFLVGWWWLRSPANYKMYYAYTGHRYEGGNVSGNDMVAAKEAAQCRVCDVMQDGHVCTRGSIVDGAFFTNSEESCDGTANGVRIAIEISNRVF